MELTDVPGIGPAKAERLREAGIKTVKDLAEVDLRRTVDAGVGNEVLKRAKQEARRLLDREGIAYAKSPYGENGKATATTKATAKTGTNGTAKSATNGSSPAAPRTEPIVAEAAPPADPVVGITQRPAARPGFFARLFKRA